MILVTVGARDIRRGIAQAVLCACGSVAIADLDVDAGKACLAEWDLDTRATFVRSDVARKSDVRLSCSVRASTTGVSTP